MLYEPVETTVGLSKQKSLLTRVLIEVNLSVQNDSERATFLLTHQRRKSWRARANFRVADGDARTSQPHPTTPNAAAMSTVQWQRPVLAATSGIARAPICARIVPIWRAVATPVTLDVGRRRHASVKAQGVYRFKPKRTVPKKLGPKKTHGMLQSASEVLSSRSN